MLVVPWPWIMRLWIEAVLKPSDKAPVSMIVSLDGSGRGVQKSFFTRQYHDTAAYSFRAVLKFLLVSRNPIRSDLAIGIRSENRFGTAFPHFQPAARFIHEQAARVSVVRMRFVEISFDDVKPECRIEALEASGYLPRAVTSIVDEENYLISLVFQRLSVKRLLLR